VGLPPYDGDSASWSSEAGSWAKGETYEE